MQSHGAIIQAGHSRGSLRRFVPWELGYMAKLLKSFRLTSPGSQDVLHASRPRKLAVWPATLSICLLELR